MAKKYKCSGLVYFLEKNTDPMHITYKIKRLFCNIIQIYRLCIEKIKELC